MTRSHQRPITIQHELDDIFIIKSGLDVNDKIVLEGVRRFATATRWRIRVIKPEDALAHQKNHAE